MDLTKKKETNNKKNIYFIHDNGARPYKVIIEKQTSQQTNGERTLQRCIIVKIYKQILDLDNYDEYETKPIIVYYPEAIFIGNSPMNEMTQFSGGYGQEFDGNTILLQTGDNIYTYIGPEIYSFKTDGKIINYISPVGNNDIAYPYAVDEYNNYYLLIEGVIIKNNSKIKKQMENYNDPYIYYYDYRAITPDMGVKPIRQQINGRNWTIERFYIGTNIYTLTYNPFPEKEYDRLLSVFKKPMYIEINQKKFKLTKPMFVKLIKNYGLLQSFEPIKNKYTYQQRLY